ncbi:hypothetical protein [Azospirillum tabaci]|uniref:hypothetical protein n=1 Tax=Azospirillum tabaci TaxID=2752310 RepID=UPI001661040E|nr:hypothetical protein [Azospirillum tabaci]
MNTDQTNLTATATATKVDDLGDLLVDESVHRDGVWMKPDPDRALRIKTKGFPDAYHDMQARQQRTAAKSFNGDVEKLPVAVKRQINAKCLIAHSLVAVENCVIGGQELSLEEFAELIKEPRGAKLLTLAFTAATMAQEAHTAETEEAAGN